ncbi:hypothetical protein AQUCO_00901024v1 [Aquilegia coerulea]|uniref:Uncharacterized protein n=1 Tax=Aquilegia coerulea TaxID=218851 RepID=A0A2G5EGE8_AQUCA|nr:hypothetical protein AQUCO_00901024v1 [Aquilegia coerulea]
MANIHDNQANYWDASSAIKLRRYDNRFERYRATLLDNLNNHNRRRIKERKLNLNFAIITQLNKKIYLLKYYMHIE